MLPCSLWWNLVHVDAEVIGREKWVAMIVARVVEREVGLSLILSL